LTNEEMAENYLYWAMRRVEWVRQLLGSGDYPVVVREAQECAELFLKGILRLVGVEPPREHDVSNSLRDNAHLFPDWFAQRVDELAEASRWLAENRGLAFYGDERQRIPPSHLYGEAEAQQAWQYLETIRDVCQRLWQDWQAARQGGRPSP
jgi:HEPN domain-containing protein